MSKILVIGGCGYIGTRLCQSLHLQGADVTSMDLCWFGRYSSIENISQDYRDITKEHLSLFSTVILLAGHSSVKMCESNMIDSFNNNVRNFVSLLSKLKKGQKFIYASSSSIYGGLDNKMMEESTNLYRALNFYDLSKYEIDCYAKLYPDIEYYGLRFGTVNGFSVNFRDEIMLNSMFSSHYKQGAINYSNPHIRRPILGLSDLCKAVSFIIKDGDFSKRGIYNLASINMTVNEIAKKASEVLGSQLIKGEDRPNAYDFTINTNLFERTFDFKFVDDISSILAEISRGQGQIVYSNRNSPQKYE